MAEVEFICLPATKCEDVENKLREARRADENPLGSLKSFALDKGVKFLRIIKQGGKTIVLIEKKPLIANLEFEVSDKNSLDPDQIQKISQLQEGTHFNESEVKEAGFRIKNWLSERGYIDPSFTVIPTTVQGGDVALKGLVGFKGILKVRDTLIDGKENRLVKELFRKIRKMKGDPYSRVNFKLVLDTILAELKNEGYLKAQIDLTEKTQENAVDLHLKVNLGKRTQFAFTGNKNISREDFVLALKKSILDGSAILRQSDLKGVVEKMYTQKGIYGSQIKLYTRKGETLEGDSVETYFFSIHEGVKYRLNKLVFKGNLIVGLETLRDLYYQKGTTLAQRDFLDETYLENFTSILKDFYLRKGFVFVDISKPRLFISDEDKSAEVTFVIKERQQSVLDKIILDGVPEEFRLKILNSMVNKVGLPLNVIELENDLARALNTLRESGFFYAIITNLNDDNVVSYESNYTKSALRLQFKPGKITRFENFVLSGNKVTKDIVLTREIRLKKGDLITPETIKQIRDRINGLGLFGKVQVLPIVTNKLSEDKYNETNLIVQVQEKKFGRGEVAPGYRTDIGAKLSFTLSKTNLLGLNDSGTLKLQVNRRFSLSQFDSRRAAERKQKIEGIGTVSYTFPYLFNYADFSGNFSVQRRRFFSFDADIFRVSPQLTKQINNIVGLSLKYQYERIRQFDATEVKDRATFEIGTITPGITLDFRDSPVSPRSGAYFGLNWEFANPYFGSQNDNDLEINFSKVISRNRFYLPLGSKNFVLALSAAAGMQQNYADGPNGFNTDGSIRTRGYIPSIKVFRLDGFDIVRGYADNEINKLDDGQDITTKRVQGKAFFANLKFEPRYYVNDTFVVGPFFDAGRLFVETFRPADLRTSAGLTLKFLTPVGTLDFDYGVKLRRDRFPGGNREAFGRFHLSIGYF